MTTLATTQGVSGALRRAGQERSQRKPSRIRGMPEWSEGYKVEKWDLVIRVEWRPSSFFIRQARDSDYAKMLDKYSEILTQAGFVVKLDDTGFTPRLVVSGRTEPKG